ncbi:hypothetical protein [Parageobacillus thermoglucosidasius]|uniref:hypothetical protein n=1 Tax=Parageobacillus thermoglucosidasius TaxID=1426 RepID=UPI000E1AD6CB|nr:hypothetical protein [Parageobacillus thermoglucosidasius]MED4904642.1 hypothetical protein [Parageobacillus thermoglucosidasius]MED4915727.1 hypothetical protein [Parageobacillus thermoglucosidasius]MED4944056.1 hypothetical protein [Parageobacillus thermoglucosidasius]MED4983917.1 hypothetical protein [Parageobacillus thermoglucosidasius]RDE28598.1 hypothetical protein DV714_05640 [Parageobacillus thermoglucosidasius]
MKTRWLFLAAALMLMLPTGTLAAQRAHDMGTDAQAFAGHMLEHGELSEQKWMEIVKKYTPDDAKEWQKVLDERKALKKQLQNEQVKKALDAKRAEMKKKREAAFDRLIDRLANKEITKEQFKNEWKLLHKRKGWMTKTEKQKLRELHHQTYEAMKENDKEALASLLPQWLEHMKKENERLAKWIQEAKQR